MLNLNCFKQDIYIKKVSNNVDNDVVYLFIYLFFIHCMQPIRLWRLKALSTGIYKKNTCDMLRSSLLLQSGCFCGCQPTLYVVTNENGVFVSNND